VIMERVWPFPLPSARLSRNIQLSQPILLRTVHDRLRRTGKESNDTRQSRAVSLTLVNVPIVINVSFRASFGLYNDLTASLMCAFRFASSIAKLLATARLVAATTVDGIADRVPPFFPGGCSPSVPSGAATAFRFFPFPLTLAAAAAAAARRLSIALCIRSSSSVPGFIILTSSDRLYFVAHCGQTSSCPSDGTCVAPPSPPAALSFPFSDGGIEEETALSPA
jgi:hypothetical protein